MNFFNRSKTHESPQPETTFEGYSSYEKQLALKTRLWQAKNFAVENSQLQAIWQEREKLSIQFLQGKIDVKKLNQRILALEKKSPVIRLKHVADFQHFLILAGLDDNQALEITKHEADHFNEANTAGLNPDFTIEISYTLSKTGTKEYLLHPKVAINPPENMPIEKMRQAVHKIALAPENPSPGDKDLLIKI